jgi:hypothetical protein
MPAGSVAAATRDIASSAWPVLNPGAASPTTDAAG